MSEEIKAVSDSIIGLDITDAEHIAQKKGLLIRPMCVDGQELLGTCDFRPNRLNIEVNDGKVAAVVSVG